MNRNALIVSAIVLSLAVAAAGVLYIVMNYESASQSYNATSEYNISEDIYENLSSTDTNITSVRVSDGVVRLNMSIDGKNRSEIFNDFGQVAGAYAVADLKDVSGNHSMIATVESGGYVQAKFRVNTSWPELLKSGEINRTEYALKVLRTYNSSV